MNFATGALKDVTFFPFWLDNDAAPDVTPQHIGHTSADLLSSAVASPASGPPFRPRKPTQTAT